MKVVVFPGVNYSLASQHKYFLDKIKTGLGCEGEIFEWEPSHTFPPFDLPLEDSRKFFCGAVWDFQRVVVHALDIKVPEADLYIGHSAGSIVALVQNKPCVIFASPAMLVEVVTQDDTLEERTREKIKAIFSNIRNNESKPILNIYNKYDIIGYPFDRTNVENYGYTGAWYNPNSYNPIHAHSDYWDNGKVINKIISTVKSWKLV